MKGYVYYSGVQASRNKAFIADLKKESLTFGIELDLLVDDEVPDDGADFILFRDRDSKHAARFEQEGFRLFNRAEVNRIANNKLRTFELVTMLGIDAVPTRRVRHADDIEAYPVVLKTVDGHGGNEVVLCESPKCANAFFEVFSDRELIMQPYIESGASDVRVFMLGTEVLGAVKRTGNDDFKSNYTLGGSIEKYELSLWQEKEVSLIARAIKSDYIGIDFLLLPDGGWILNEIEDPVGARSLYATHDFSVASALMGYIDREMRNSGTSYRLSSSALAF